ncbi:hypothetical protein PFISCL1PPCAC_27950, partial [Pristionchus fissidentatus]
LYDASTVLSHPRSSPRCSSGQPRLQEVFFRARLSWTSVEESVGRHRIRARVEDLHDAVGRAVEGDRGGRVGWLLRRRRYGLPPQLLQQGLHGDDGHPPERQGISGELR